MRSFSSNMFEPLVIFLCGGGVATAIMFFYLSSNAALRPCVEETNSSNLIGNNFSLSKQAANPTKEADIDEELLDLLQRAAMDDKTVLMTEINGAWAAPNSLFDLFLESFHEGYQIEYLLNHMIVVATDIVAFQKCKSVHPFCYQYKVAGVNFTEEKSYKTKDYLAMMWTRNRFQRTILEMGYTFLFTDTDIMWFRNPFPYISVIAQITIGSDWSNGNPDDLWGSGANGGFLYVKPTNRTIEFFKDWYKAGLNHTDLHDQEVFELVKGELSARNQVKIRFLDTKYVGGLCQPKIDFNILCTFHATCRIGLESKFNEMKKILDAWKLFKKENGI